MSTSYKTRYKDSDPLITIERIRSILSGLGIMTVERWHHDVEGYYSLHIEIQGTYLFSNGKGSTAAYALASAYAEMLERLQSLLFAQSNRGLSEKAINYGGFCFAPDEKVLNKAELRDNDNKWIAAFSNEKSVSYEKKHILEMWRRGFCEDMDSCLALPYLNITDRQIYYIPVPALVNVYSSNGMCAGNTDSEALVQGISEVIERYVQKRIILDRIVPPTIPEAYIRDNYPYLYDMIRTLESKGDFKIIVKDCSLGKGFPVAAIIFFDRKMHSYFIRFGAHPAFEIALERCLTELLQGKSINNLNWMVQLSFSEKDIYSFSNLAGLYINGTGHYPSELFGDKYSYEFTGIKDMSGYGNENMLSYLIDLMHSNGCNILIRDVSFLGFPTFQVIVPFFSEMIDSDIWYFKSSSDLKRAAEIVMRLENASNDELRQVIDYMRGSDFGPNDSIAGMLHRSIGSAFSWNNVKTDLFISSAYYKMGEFKKAYEAMDSFVKIMKSKYNEPSNEYFNCIRDYYGALARGMDNKAGILRILKEFHPEDIVDRALSSLENPGEIFKNCSRLNCFNCSVCPDVKQCYYPQRERLFMKLKDAYAGNVIDQRRLVGLFKERSR